MCNNPNLLYDRTIVHSVRERGISSVCCGMIDLRLTKTQLYNHSSTAETYAHVDLCHTRPRLPTVLLLLDGRVVAL